MSIDPYVLLTLGPQITPALTLADFVRCRYEPQPDITAYELAQIIPYFAGGHLTRKAWEKLGSANRHLPICGP